MELACSKLNAPPSPKDIMKCEYGESYWRSFVLKSGLGDEAPRQMALNMWRNTYNAAKDVCSKIQTGGLVDLAAPADLQHVHIGIVERMAFPMRFAHWQNWCLQEAMSGHGVPCRQPRLPMTSLVEGADEKQTKLDKGVQVFTFLEQCNSMIRPLSDFDHSSGHGNLTCRYEPLKEDLLKFHDNPEDIAILAPFNGYGGRPPSDFAHMNAEHLPDLGVDSWRSYARFHNYSFYTGAPEELSSSAEELCPGLAYRAPYWMKPCMARQLIKKHKYLLVVDTDTFVTRPGLRLEPLFEKAGLLKDGGKVMAAADEWGSCWGGKRAVLGGDRNTGVLLLKRSDLTAKALEKWWEDPMKCVPKDKSLLALREVKMRNLTWTRFLGYGLIEGNWLEYDHNPEPCKLLLSSLRGWAYDQLGFWLSVASNPTFKDAMHTFPSGCPINGPWAEFISHMPSGSVAEEYFDPRDRVGIMQGAHRCIKDVLDSARDSKTLIQRGQVDAVYKRCSICDMLPKKLALENSWNLSCPNARKPAV